MDFQKKIKIFLASSITEFESDRLKFERFINHLGRAYRENYNIDIIPLLCEDYDSDYKKERSQDIYNKDIETSDIVVFLFGKNAGDYTVEEFEIARKAYESSEKTPKIYIFVKSLKDSERDNSLISFLKKLEKKLGHYCDYFDSIDKVNLTIIENIIELCGLGNLKYEENKIYFDKEILKDIDANSLDFIKNNKELRNINIRLSELSSKKDNSTDEADEISELKKRAKELTENAFKAMLGFYKHSAYGEVTPKIARAKKYFDKGDYEKAADSINIDEAIAEHLRRTEQFCKQSAEMLCIEAETKINILLSMGIHRKAHEIMEIYENVILYAEQNGIKPDFIKNYADMLMLYGSPTDAEEHINKAIEIYTKTAVTESEKNELIKCYELRDTIRSIKQANDNYEKSRALLAELQEKGFNCDLVNTAIDCALKALDIRLELYMCDPYPAYNKPLGQIDEVLGFLYYIKCVNSNNSEAPSKAIKYIKKAIDFYKFALKIKVDYCYNGLARSYYLLSLMEKGKEESRQKAFDYALENPSDADCRKIIKWFSDTNETDNKHDIIVFDFI